MTALHIVPDDEPGGLPLAAWNQVVDHVKACWPYSRPWTVDTQQAFYDVLRGYSREELIGAASRLAASVARRNPRDIRERPSLAELREAASSERAELERIRDEVRLAVVTAPPRSFAEMALEPPDDTAGPYERLLYARHTGEVGDDARAHEAFLRQHGARLENPEPPPLGEWHRDRNWMR